MKIKVEFNIRKGKFKMMDVLGCGEPEQCSICGSGHEGDLVGDICYYLSSNKSNLHLQICDECYGKLKLTSDNPNRKVKK